MITKKSVYLFSSLELLSYFYFFRLYRRTNRELPCKPCTYMTSLLEPINHFSSVTAGQSPKCTLHQWLVAIFAKVSVKLLSNVSEVLDNVQKMEESLLRLRRVRLFLCTHSRVISNYKRLFVRGRPFRIS